MGDPGNKKKTLVLVNGTGLGLFDTKQLTDYLGESVLLSLGVAFLLFRRRSSGNTSMGGKRTLCSTEMVTVLLFFVVHFFKESIKYLIIYIIIYT